MNRTHQKILAMLGCYLCDITLIAWLYFRVTQYGLYSDNIGSKIDSPDFQVQLYKIMLQSLSFALLLFIIAQTIVYLLAWKKFRSAYFYLKYFSVLGFVLGLFITVKSSAFALLPMIIYIGGYYIFSKLFKESSAILQKSHLLPKQQ